MADIDMEIDYCDDTLDVNTQIEILLGIDDFVKLSKSPAYVDKTLLIEVILFGCGQQTSVVAPRRFSKTSNLRMLQAFFSSDQSTLDERRAAFKNLKIWSKVKARKHFGSYPVIFVDFAYGIPTVKTKADALQRCRDVMFKAYADHTYLPSYFNRPEIAEAVKNVISISAVNQWFDRSLKPDELMVSTSLADLAKCLKYYHGKKPIILIDEFDSICSDALFHCNEDVLNSIIKCYARMTGNLLKHSKANYEKAVLTGITSVTCKGLTTLNDLATHRVLRDDKFAPFYGLTSEEFSKLLNVEGLEEAKLKEDEAFRFYNGYQYKMKSGTSFTILNLYSVVKFLAKGKVDSYWEGSGLVIGLSETLRCDGVIQNIHKLFRGELLTIKDMNSLEPADLAKFNDISKDPTKEFIDIDFLFNFILQQGYLAIDSENGDLVNLKVPNEEVMEAFHEIIRKYYVDICGYNNELLNQCGECLIALNHSDVNIEERMNQLCKFLNHVFIKKETHTDEYWFEHLLFYILFRKRMDFDVNSQNRVEQQRDGRKQKRFDVLVSAKTETRTDFLFELMVCEANKPVDNALDQIIEKKYHEACKSRRYFLIGITLVNESGNNTVTMEYLYNDLNLNNRKLCEV